MLARLPARFCTHSPRSSTPDVSCEHDCRRHRSCIQSSINQSSDQTPKTPNQLELRFRDRPTAIIQRQSFHHHHHHHHPHHLTFTISIHHHSQSTLRRTHLVQQQQATSRDRKRRDATRTRAIVPHCRPQARLRRRRRRCHCRPPQHHAATRSFSITIESHSRLVGNTGTVDSSLDYTNEPLGGCYQRLPSAYAGLWARCSLGSMSC